MSRPDAKSAGSGWRVRLAGFACRAGDAVARIFADAVFPRHCVECGAALDGEPDRNLCWGCKGELAYQSVANYCARCGRSMVTPSGGAAAFRCLACQEHEPGFDLARSAVHYRDPAKNMVIGLKYNQGVWLVNDLADLLEACVRGHYSGEAIDVVAPVPLHWRRRLERRYNQSGELARVLAARLGVPYIGNAVRRIRYTRTQTSYGADERRANMRGAFRVNGVFAPRLRFRNVLLVDDVMTTGATASEAARALKRDAGVSRVIVATVARD